MTGTVDWDEVKELLLNSYRSVALKRMIARLDEGNGKVPTRSRRAKKK